MTGLSRRPNGFTLIELLIVFLLIGVLAGLALPNIRGAVYRADAARIVGDARAVELGVRTYTEDKGGYPAGAGWGTVPPALAPYLPSSMPFTYKGVEYRLVTQVSAPHVRLEVQYSANDGVGLALQQFAGPNVTWTATRTTFWFQG